MIQETYDAAGVLQAQQSAPFAQTFVVRRATGARWLNVRCCRPGRELTPPGIVASGRGPSDAQFRRGHLRPRDPRLDLGERRVPRGRGVVAERREAAVVGRAEAAGSMKRAASSTRSRTSSGVSIRGSSGSVTPTNMRRSPTACWPRIPSTRSRSCSLESWTIERVHVQAEEAGQQGRVVDVGAVGRVLVAAGAGVDAHLRPLVLREPAEDPVVQVDEGVQQAAGRIELE